MAGVLRVPRVILNQAPWPPASPGREVATRTVVPWETVRTRLKRPLGERDTYQTRLLPGFALSLPVPFARMDEFRADE